MLYERKLTISIFFESILYQFTNNINNITITHDD